MTPPIKCTVIGSSQSGKTTLIRTFISKKFFPCATPTSYREYKAKATATNGSRKKLIISDTSGLETFDTESRSYYANSDVFIICFSLTDPDYFGYIRRRFLPHLREYYAEVPIILVGTKMDLRDDEEYRDLWSFAPITKEQGLRFALEIGAVEYLECSAVTKQGISVVFDTATTCALCYRSIPRKNCIRI
ncbi:ras-related C3 botulinum toxin substrate 3-like [Stomoxys calcitrans]|uniref:ras-related C3 botulinum toxin substrate 3-like n=1 Tax=Stomoxys calcitrans TaxID=35570 RepID=UPI0027E2C0A9|nr:ras-related C3 botulinum toxin substrate 3-like [Stomoxys calcitrans]